MVRPVRDTEKAAWVARETARLTDRHVEQKPVDEEPTAREMADFRALLAAARADGVDEYRYVHEAIVEAFDAFEAAQPEQVRARIPEVERFAIRELRKRLR